MTELSDEIYYNAIVECSKLTQGYSENVKRLAKEGQIGQLPEAIDTLKDTVSKLDWLVREVLIRLDSETIKQALAEMETADTESKRIKVI